MGTTFTRLLVPACLLLGVLGISPAAVAAPAPAPAPAPRTCPNPSVPTGARALPADLDAGSWVVADLDTGAVLASCGAHDRRLPASTLKLLTAVTALPRLNLTDAVTVTAADLAFEPGSSAVGLVEGGTYTVETLFLGLLLVSGNDAANVLARLAGGPGGKAAGLAAMNAEAAALGARDTHAVNPHGLDAHGQTTSAHDLAVIARAAFAKPEFARLDATRTAQIPSQVVTRPGGRVKSYGGFQIQNDNRLLASYPGALGGKTGFTDVARHTYVGAAERDGRRLVVTMMRGEQAPVRLTEQAAALLDWGFATRGSVGTLPPLPTATPREPPPSVLAEERFQRPNAAAVAPAAGGGAGLGTVLLTLLGTLATLVTALRIRVKLRLARRRQAQLRRQRARARPPARRPGSGRPVRPAHHPRRGPGPSRAYRSR